MEFGLVGGVRGLGFEGLADGGFLERRFWFGCLFEAGEKGIAWLRFFCFGWGVLGVVAFEYFLKFLLNPVLFFDFLQELEKGIHVFEFMPEFMLEKGGTDMKNFKYCFVVGHAFHGFLIDRHAIEPIIDFGDKKLCKEVFGLFFIKLSGFIDNRLDVGRK